MKIEWIPANGNCYQLKANGSVEAVLKMEDRNFLYYPAFGYDEHNEPFPSEHLSLDDLKAWAEVIYRMGG